MPCSSRISLGLIMWSSTLPSAGARFVTVASMESAAGRGVRAKPSLFLLVMTTSSADLEAQQRPPILCEDLELAPPARSLSAAQFTGAPPLFSRRGTTFLRPISETSHETAQSGAS